MKVQIYEVVKQYVFWVDALPHTVKGRVSRQLDLASDRPYTWDISHYYKPSKDATTVYIPSLRSTATIEEAEQLLFSYARSFTDIEVAPENYF